MTKLYLVRHGETDYNVEKRCQGQRDVPLNANGFQQARTVAAYFETLSFSFLYTSDLSRALDTANLIAAPHGIQPKTDSQLREISRGDVEGTLWTDIRAAYPAAQRVWDDLEHSLFRNGESPNDLTVRTRAFLSELPVGQAEPIVIVTHGGFIRTVISIIESLPMKEAQAIHMDNVSITEVELSRNESRVVTINSTEHLSTPTLA